MTAKKPSHEEDEYFARVEIDKRKVYAEEVKAKMQAEELEKLKEQHWMHCTKCGFEMHSVVFKGVTIEQCPHCGGVYLDAGELEELAGKETGFLKGVLSLFKFSEEKEEGTS